MNVRLTGGSLRESEICVLAKDLRAPITKHTSHRSEREPGRILVDFSGGNEFLDLRGKRYAIVFRDDPSRYMWVYLLRRKNDAAIALEKFLWFPF